MNVKGGDAHWAKQVPDGHTGGSPSGDMFPYWPPVWLSAQGDPGIPTAELREAADWPGRNKSPTLPSQPPRTTWSPEYLSCAI